MNIQQASRNTASKRAKVFLLILLYSIGLLLCVAITALFGLVPFVLGVLVQAAFPKRIPPFVIGLLATAAFFLLRYFTRWPLPITVGDGVPIWPSVLISLYVFLSFFASGAALIREFSPLRFPR